MSSIDNWEVLPSFISEISTDQVSFPPLETFILLLV